MTEPTEPALQDTIGLVEAARAGDSDAMESLFRRYLPRVEQIVALRLGWTMRKFVEVEDVVQEVLLKTFRSIERFEPRSEGSFRHWIAEQVRCEIVDQSRRAKAKKRGEGHEVRFGDCERENFSESIFRGKDPTPSQVLQRKELEERIEAALLQLPEPWREVIILRRLCEMPYDEIAATLGFEKEASARKAFSRALKKLEPLIEQP